MLRRATAVVSGLMVGVLLIMVIKAVSVIIYRPPSNAGPGNNQIPLDFMMTRPLGALAIVLLAYAVGSFAGAATAASVSDEDPRRPAMTVGALLLIAGIMDVLQRPHPFWFAVANMLVYLPFAWLGGKFVEWRRRAQPRTEPPVSVDLKGSEDHDHGGD